MIEGLIQRFTKDVFDFTGVWYAHPRVPGTITRLLNEVIINAVPPKRALKCEKELIESSASAIYLVILTRISRVMPVDKTNNGRSNGDFVSC